MASLTSSPAYTRLIHQLSSDSPAQCKSQKVDFEQAGLQIYKDRFALVIEDALSVAECKLLLQVAQEQKEWEQALVRGGMKGDVLNTDIRLCKRILWDDQQIADGIMARVLPHLPQEIVTLENNAGITGNGPVKRNERWQILRLNERLRFLKYIQGDYFRPHCDGSYQSPEQDVTFLTVHLYLNGADDIDRSGHNSNHIDGQSLLGGATRFFGLGKGEDWDLNPRTGSILVFQHRYLRHSGEEVLQGTKYTMRSDVLYRKMAS